jgi:ComF family protein
MDVPHCGACQKKPPAFDEAIALFRYDTPVDRLIQALKYRGQLDQARLLGTLLAQRLQAASPARPDCLLPVPLHPARLRERGYNQSLELAKPVARALALPLERHAVQRVRATRPQMELARAERARNLRNAFQTEQDFHDQHIAIIDDVMTSGHTVNALARCLKRAGARRVSVWVIARA